MIKLQGILETVVSILVLRGRSISPALLSLLTRVAGLGLGAARVSDALFWLSGSSLGKAVGSTVL